MTEPGLRVERVSYVYPDGQRALDDVSLVVEAGERVALLGPNGAGKSTLALHLNGILQPTSGTVTIGGHPAQGPDLADLRRHVQLVFADADDQLFMPTVIEDVAFGPANAGLRGGTLQGRAEQALADVGASDLAHRSAHRLSSGEKRRVALATALAVEPRVLVLDEPTAGLDPAGHRELAELLDGIELTLLVITHDLPFALRVCDRAVIIDQGRLHADGPMLETLSDRDLLATHRLELPFGFDPAALTGMVPRRDLGGSRPLLE